MPERDGFEFVERPRRAQRNIPTRVVTALDLSAGERDELRLGLDHYVSPRRLSRAEFREEVRQRLRTSRPPRAEGLTRRARFDCPRTRRQR